jgi:hypothetical protein
MAQAGGLKGNPAHKRIGNPAAKIKRERSWARGQAKKAARRALQEAQHAAKI